MYTFADFQNEVKFRSIRDQGGTQFDTAVKNIINTSLFRVNRESPWRSMRRISTFDTVTTYTTGTGGGTFTANSKNITVVGATFITDGIRIGRKILLQGSSKTYKIKTITGETTLTVDRNYDGTTITGTGTYSILPQEEYNLPIQAGHRTFLWHEEYGYPMQMTYSPDQEFFQYSSDTNSVSTPELYRMWGEDMVIAQVLEPSVITISSSVSSDTNISVTVFGIVSGYPDYEVITTNASNGTTAVAGSKSFSLIERVVKGSSSTGRITVTANSGNTTVAVLPVGDTTAGIMYRKVQLWPLPDRVMPINIHYYKDPYRLVNDNDVHELGKDFDEAIILLSTAKMKYDQGQKEDGDRFLALYGDELRSLKKVNTDKLDWFPKLHRYDSGDRNPMIHSNLSYRQTGLGIRV